MKLSPQVFKYGFKNDILKYLKGGHFNINQKTFGLVWIQKTLVWKIKSINQTNLGELEALEYGLCIPCHKT